MEPFVLTNYETIAITHYVTNSVTVFLAIDGSVKDADLCSLVLPITISFKLSQQNADHFIS